MNKEKLSNVINRELFLYGGISRDEFDSIKEWRNKTNWRNWTVISLVAAVYFTVLIFTTFSVKSIEVNTFTYVILAAVSAILFILFNTVAKGKTGTATTVLSYLAFIQLLAFGIVVGEVLTPEFVAVTYNVMLIGLPLFITDKPYRIAITLLCSTGVFIVLCGLMKTGEVRELDLYNVLCFLGVSLVLVFYNGYSKAHSALNLKKLEMSNLTDSLTGLGNRKAFNKYVEDNIGTVIPDNLAVASIDINGLKGINDRYGHAAGDELIVKAAEILKECFEGYGQVYRIGGDEFFAGFYASQNSIMLIDGTLRAKAREVEIDDDMEMSFSVGFATAVEYPGMSVEQLTRVSDRKMYENKRKFYSRSDTDRRSDSGDVHLEIVRD